MNGWSFLMARRLLQVTFRRTPEGSRNDLGVTKKRGSFVRTHPSLVYKHTIWFWLIIPIKTTRMGNNYSILKVNSILSSLVKKNYSQFLAEHKEIFFTFSVTDLKVARPITQGSHKGAGSFVGIFVMYVKLEILLNNVNMLRKS